MTWVLAVGRRNILYIYISSLTSRRKFPSHPRRKTLFVKNFSDNYVFNGKLYSRFHCSRTALWTSMFLLFPFLRMKSIQHILEFCANLYKTWNIHYFWLCSGNLHYSSASVTPTQIWCDSGLISNVNWNILSNYLLINQ